MSVRSIKRGASASRVEPIRQGLHQITLTEPMAYISTRVFCRTLMNQIGDAQHMFSHSIANLSSIKSLK
jgi:hypothetical protein